MARNVAQAAEKGGVTRGRVGLTFDAGALIALERRTQRIWQIYRTAVEEGIIVTVPAPVLVEWWRGRTDVRERIFGGVRVESLHEDLARAAGEAIATVRSATPIDAIVMASAASRGDVVYTSDVEDLEKLRRHFPSVRVLSV